MISLKAFEMFREQWSMEVLNFMTHFAFETIQLGLLVKIKLALSDIEKFWMQNLQRCQNFLMGF